MPEVAVAVAVVWLAAKAPNRIARAVSVPLVCVMLIVDVAYWRLPDLVDLHFDTYVAAFKALPVGAHIQIPINPPGWSFELTKKPGD
jgi:hypothetical protein